jgi:hypothetical protein
MWNFFLRELTKSLYLYILLVGLALYFKQPAPYCAVLVCVILFNISDAHNRVNRIIRAITEIRERDGLIGGNLWLSVSYRLQDITRHEFIEAEEILQDRLAIQAALSS